MVLSRHRHNHFHYHRLCHVHVFTPLQPPWGLQANNYLMEILALGCQRVLFKESMSLKVWILSFCLHLDLVETVQEVQWKWKWKCKRCNGNESESESARGAMKLDHFLAGWSSFYSAVKVGEEILSKVLWTFQIPTPVTEAVQLKSNNAQVASCDPFSKLCPRLYLFA